MVFEAKIMYFHLQIYDSSLNFYRFFMNYKSERGAPLAPEHWPRSADYVWLCRFKCYRNLREFGDFKDYFKSMELTDSDEL